MEKIGQEKKQTVKAEFYIHDLLFQANLPIKMTIPELEMWIKTNEEFNDKIAENRLPKLQKNDILELKYNSPDANPVDKNRHLGEFHPKKRLLFYVKVLGRNSVGKGPTDRKQEQIGYKNLPLLKSSTSAISSSQGQKTFIIKNPSAEFETNAAGSNNTIVGEILKNSKHLIPQKNPRISFEVSGNKYAQLPLHEVIDQPIENVFHMLELKQKNLNKGDVNLLRSSKQIIVQLIQPYDAGFR